VILEGDCIEVMASMDAASVDAIVTDPPYGLGFMGKRWDALPPGEDVAREMLRVLKPGGHLLAFGGTRTYHRLAVAVEDAGFEIRDTIAWLYGSGFPKSHNIGDGRGTALKPAHEPIVVARKPLGGTVAANVVEHGTGALNIDACRITSAESWEGDATASAAANGFGPGDSDGWRGAWTRRSESHTSGRWPANVVLDEEAAGMLDAQTGEQKSGVAVNRNRAPGTMTSWLGTRPSQTGEDVGYGDSGGASRFFYVAKASRRERNAGLDGFEERPKRHAYGDGFNSATKLDPARHTAEGVAARPLARNHHPTVKPIALMRWLVRLVAPPGGTVLDPFAGSGTTGCAAALEGFEFIGIEREPEYARLAEARIAHWTEQAA
jgi:DNA modification methylase